MGAGCNKGVDMPHTEGDAEQMCSAEYEKMGGAQVGDIYMCDTGIYSAECGWFCVVVGISPHGKAEVQWFDHVGRLHERFWMMPDQIHNMTKVWPRRERCNHCGRYYKELREPCREDAQVDHGRGL